MTVKRGDLIVATLTQDFGQVSLPFFVKCVHPTGLWSDVPTMTLMHLGKLEEVRDLLEEEEPKLLVSVYGPYPSKFRYLDHRSESSDEHRQWDLVHVHTHTYLPMTEQGLEHIEVVGEVVPDVFREIHAKALPYLGVVPTTASEAEYARYLEAIMFNQEEENWFHHEFWRRYG